MQKVDPKNVEMIRRREKRGFCYVNRSFVAEKVDKSPDVNALEKLAAEGWWDADSVMTDFSLDHNGAPVPVETRLRMVYDNAVLFAAFRMEEPCMDRTRVLITEQGQRETRFPHPEYERSGREPFPYEISKDDHVKLLLDVANRRKRYVSLLVNMAGVHLADEAEFGYAEAVYPECRYLEPWAKPYDCRVVKGDGYWCAAFAIPWSSLETTPDDAVMMGINASRGRTVREWHNHLLAWAPDAGALSAFDFAHLYFGAQRVEVAEIDLGRPVLDRNELRIQITNTSDEDLGLRCAATVTVEASGAETSHEEAGLTLSAGASETVLLAYTLDWHECGSQALCLTVCNDDHGDLFETWFYLGNHGVPVPAEYPWDFSEPQPDPDPEDEDFVSKKLKYYLSRVPKFTRVTTNDGAPSDFCLRSVCGTYDFNLMKPGVLTEIADMVADLFDDTQDRLCALSLLAHQDAFSLHIAPHVSMHRKVSSLSALRLNAGHCYSRALVWLGIARELKTGNGEERYGERAHALLVMGHVIGAIETGDGDDRYVFDPSFGTFHFRWDNTGLATQRELADDHELASRGVRGRLNDFINLQCHTPISDGPVVFPQLAPGS